MVSVPRPRLVSRSTDLNAEDLPDQVTIGLRELVGAAKEGLLALSVGVGLAVVQELFEAEVMRLAGPKCKHDPDRRAYRHGQEDRQVTLGGHRVQVSKPRVRSVEDEEVELRTFRAFSHSAWALPELVEAATRAGQAHVATAALQDLSDRARASGTEWALGIEARSRALVAEEMFAGMGARSFAQRTRRELLATGERARRRAVDTTDSLTTQEKQVAHLARDGRSNQEIGGASFSSVRRPSSTTSTRRSPSSASGRGTSSTVRSAASDYG